MMVPASLSLRLRQAIIQNDLSLVERILKNNTQLLYNPDFDNKSNTSLHYAAESGHADIAKHLITQGHDQKVELKDYIFTSADNNLGISINTDGQCALHIAAARHHVDLIELLCEHFPHTVNRKDRQGQTPLLLATKGTNPSGTSSKRPSSSSTDDLRALEILLQHGADVLTQDYEGNSCLHVACAWGNLKAARALVQAGADPLRSNYTGWTPDAYSLTVQADVYYRTLVAEFEKRKAEEMARVHERRRTVGGGGRVRLVTDQDEDDDSDVGSTVTARTRAGTHSTQRTDRSDSLENYHSIPGGLGISVVKNDAWRG